MESFNILLTRTFHAWYNEENTDGGMTMMLLLFPLGILVLYAMYKGAVFFDYVLSGVLAWLIFSLWLGLHTAYASVAMIGVVIAWHFISGREIFGVKVFRAVGALASAVLMTWLVPYLFLMEFAIDPEWIVVIRVAVFVIIMFVRFNGGKIISSAA